MSDRQSPAPTHEAPEPIGDELARWVTELSSALGLPGAHVAAGGELLALTREVAHGVTRPAGPLATYLVGLAVASGRTLDDAVAVTRETVARWGR